MFGAWRFHCFSLVSHVRVQECARRGVFIIEQVDVFLAVRCQNLSAEIIVHGASDGHIDRLLLERGKKLNV